MLYRIKKTGIKHIKKKLNSLRLEVSLSNSKRYFSLIENEYRKSLKMIKRQLKDNNTLIWPDNKMLGIIRKEVFKQQMELVNLADVYGLHSDELFKKQKLLFNSLFFKIMAVDKLSKSKGSRTPEINNIKLTSHKKDRNLYLELLESINRKIKNPHNYKPKPLKIWIPKISDQLRPLGIPTVEDSVIQHLLNLILEPLIEMSSEPHSFGFRLYRSAKQAISYLLSELKTVDEEIVKKQSFQSSIKKGLFQLLPESKAILNADIKGFFDIINHEWIMNNLFLHADLLTFIKAILKSGFINKKIYFQTETGTPQGSIASTTLANFTLNGLEKTTMNSLKSLTRKKKKILVRLKNGSKTLIDSCLAYVRYADDFIVITRSKHIMNKYVIPSIKKFLKNRGLSLNSEKAITFRLNDKNAQLDFLGYTFKYNKKWSKKQRIFYTHYAGSRGIALYPNKIKKHQFIRKIKSIFKKSQNLDAYHLIAKLNPILSGWSNYYNLANSSHYRSTVSNSLYHLTWKWASKKHKRWGKKLIANTYFLTKNPENISSSRKFKNYKKIGNVKWVFHGIVRNESSYKTGKLRTIYLVNVTNISQLLPSKHFILPNKLLNIHGYHVEYMRLITFNTNLKFKSAGINSSFKQRLLFKQNNLCIHCKESLSTSDGWYGDSDLHIHHIKSIFKGGSRDSITNMVLLHSWCYRDMDHNNESLEQ